MADVLNKENNFKCTLPGKGCVPIQEVYNAFGGDRFDGWFTFKWEKIWHNELEEPETVLPHFMEYIKNTFKNNRYP